MPTWVLIVALLTLPPILLLACEYAGVDPVAVVAFAVSVTLGPVVVLTSRAFAWWTGVSAVHLAAWAEWTVVAAPPTAAVAVLIWSLRRSIREDRDALPDSRCARCDTALYANHARRYAAITADYLCPPEVRTKNMRRHLPAEAIARDGSEP